MPQNHLVHIEVHHRPHHHIAEEQQRIVQITDQGHIGQTEQERDAEDRNHRTPGRKAHGQKFVVDMRLVRHERIPATAHTAQHHPHHIQTQGTSSTLKAISMAPS